MRSRTIPALAAAALIGALAPVAHSQTAPAGGGTSVLRIACEGASAGAEITINGAFKGECPFDTAVPAGTVKLRAFKAPDPLRESVLEQEFKVGEGIVKRIDIELPEPQLTARGRQLQEAWVKEQEAEKAQAAAELALARKAKTRADIDQFVDMVLAKRRTERGTASAPCPDCPLGMPPGANVTISTPRLSDPTLQAMLAWSEQGLQSYIASRGAGIGPPSQKQPLPCPEAEAQLRKLANVRDFSEYSEAEKSELRRDSKDPDFERYTRDVQIWPVRAACVDGQLDGPLEYWIFFNIVTYYNKSGINTLIILPTLTHAWTAMTAGNASDLISVKSLNADFEYYTKSNQNGDWTKLANLFPYAGIHFVRREPGEVMTTKRVNLYAMLNTTPDDKATLTDTAVRIPEENGTYTVEEYTGSDLSTRSNNNVNGRHGTYESFGASKQQTCFRDGVQVASGPC